MEYEWDEGKRQQNIAKHGVDFMQIELFDWENALGYQDVRNQYGEPRHVAYGKIRRRIYVCVYTDRGIAKRIISLRKANKREETFYEKATQTTHR